MLQMFCNLDVAVHVGVNGNFDFLMFMLLVAEEIALILS